MSNKVELKEIRKNQTGLGLLIERDGYISMSESENKNIMENIKNGGWEVPDPFIVDAVFQKFDIENANNRIYPESILKPQVDVYIKKYVQQNCSTGEADHPECVCDKDAKILTSEGWVSLWDDLTDKKVLTYNSLLDLTEYKVISNQYIKDYKGKVIHIKSNNMDAHVTDNHKFQVFRSDGSLSGFYTAKQIMNKEIENQDKCYILNTLKWHGTYRENFVLNGVTEFPKFYTKKMIKHYSESVVIKMDSWLKLIALYLSCGHVNYNRNMANVYLSFYNKKELPLLIELCNELPFSYVVSKKRGNKTSVIIKDIRLSEYFRSIPKNKIPKEVMSLNSESLRLFYDWYLLGLNEKSNKNIAQNENIALDLNETLLKIGYSSSITCLEEQYFVEKSLSSKIFLNEKLEMCEEEYNGKVACVEVENHNFFCMTNGKCYWSGNSSSISTKTISHIILELHWEGNTLVGKMKILTSEGFRKFGIISCMGDMIANLLLSGVKVGVSSRGIGSVENKMGKYYVSDDFELVCWDIVTQPSTPGSWIGLNKQEIQQYVESKDKTDNTILEKIKKLDKYITLKS